MRKLGGPGHQFEVNGENLDMYPTWWRNVGTQALQERIGLGGWRIEVEPRNKQKEDLFLHVLQVSDDGVVTMAPVELLERDGQVGARIVSGTRACEVLFPTTGPVAGHLRLLVDGRPVVDAPLATEVRDNYRAWKDDPRYPKWIGDRYYRAVIGPGG